MPGPVGNVGAPLITVVPAGRQNPPASAAVTATAAAPVVSPATLVPEAPQAALISGTASPDRLPMAAGYRPDIGADVRAHAHFTPDTLTVATVQGLMTSYPGFQTYVQEHIRGVGDLLPEYRLPPERLAQLSELILKINADLASLQDDNTTADNPLQGLTTNDMIAKAANLRKKYNEALTPFLVLGAAGIGLICGVALLTGENATPDEVKAISAGLTTLSAAFGFGLSELLLPHLYRRFTAHSEPEKKQIYRDYLNHVLEVLRERVATLGDESLVWKFIRERNDSEQIMRQLVLIREKSLTDEITRLDHILAAMPEQGEGQVAEARKHLQAKRKACVQEQMSLRMQAGLIEAHRGDATVSLDLLEGVQRIMARQVVEAELDNL